METEKNESKMSRRQINRKAQRQVDRQTIEYFMENQLVLNRTVVKLE